MAWGACTRAPNPPPAAAPLREADFAALDRYRQPDKVLAAFPPLAENEWVADVGAGGGYFALKLARRVRGEGRVVATDVDDTALAALRERAQHAGLADRIATRRVAATDPGLERDRYTAILLSDVDHLLVNRVDYFRALRLALRAGGVIVIVNHARYREACVAALVTAGFAVEPIAEVPPEQLLVRARVAN